MANTFLDVDENKILSSLSSSDGFSNLDPNEYRAGTISSSWDERFSAGFELSKETNAVLMAGIISPMALNDLRERSTALLDTNQLREMYPEKDWKQYSVLGNYEAQFIYDRFLQQRKWEQTISSVDTATFGAISTNFAASASGILTDPIEMSINLAGNALGSWASKWKTFSRFNPKYVALGTNLTENIVGNTISEIGVMQNANRMQRDYGASEFVMNAAIMPMIFTGTAASISNVFSGVKRLGSKFVDKIDIITENAINHGKSIESIVRTIEAVARQTSIGDQVTIIKSIYSKAGLGDVASKWIPETDIREIMLDFTERLHEDTRLNAFSSSQRVAIANAIKEANPKLANLSNAKIADDLDFQYNRRNHYSNEDVRAYDSSKIETRGRNGVIEKQLQDESQNIERLRVERKELGDKDLKPSHFREVLSHENSFYEYTRHQNYVGFDNVSNALDNTYGIWDLNDVLFKKGNNAVISDIQNKLGRRLTLAELKEVDTWFKDSRTALKAEDLATYEKNVVGFDYDDVNLRPDDATLKTMNDELSSRSSDIDYDEDVDIKSEEIVNNRIKSEDTQVKEARKIVETQLKEVVKDNLDKELADIDLQMTKKGGINDQIDFLNSCLIG